MTDNSKLNELEPYIPSSSEKKQAVMMYMMAWLILSMWKREVSPFTHHHIKQSLWWLVSLSLIIFVDIILIIIGFMFSAISWMIFSFFSFIAFLVSSPILIVGGMWIYQATNWLYIWENEFINRFFLFFSWIGNRVLNLFDANHYQIIDEERYRSEDQFYRKSEQNGENIQQTSQNTSEEISWSNDILDWKILDNNQQNVINNQDIWIDLSGHEINNPDNQINN